MFENFGMKSGKNFIAVRAYALFIRSGHLVFWLLSQSYYLFYDHVSLIFVFCL